MSDKPGASRPAAQPTAKVDVPFGAHVELLRFFMGRRAELVERVQGLLNAQRQPPQHLQDRRLLARRFGDAFFTLPGVAPDRARLRGQLEEAHWASGFEPRETPGVHNDLVNPAEMMRRAFHLWAQTRWPGRNGRVRYAHTLFDVFAIRQLALLAMRVWDDGASGAGERLAEIQSLLDELRRGAPADQPVLVRDARWLIPLATSPATEALEPYFRVAERIATAFSADDRLAIQQAVARTAGGHLRSYLHYQVTQRGKSLDDGELIALVRRSNALDFSLLIDALAPLLEAYEHAVRQDDRERRLALADSVCQGVSVDPELFVERTDLLGRHSMVEELFEATDGDRRVVATPLGRRHARLLEEYEARIERVAAQLHEDCRHFRPAPGGYSPYGLLYGFTSNILEHIALKSSQPDAIARFGLEDAFTAGGADKLAWVDGWRKLPHVAPDVQKLYAYPHAFAETMFARVEDALGKRARAAA